MIRLLFREYERENRAAVGVVIIRRPFEGKVTRPAASLRGASRVSNEKSSSTLASNAFWQGRHP
jgi:hypothetical protein